LVFIAILIYLVSESQSQVSPSPPQYVDRTVYVNRPEYIPYPRYPRHYHSWWRHWHPRSLGGMLTVTPSNYDPSSLGGMLTIAPANHHSRSMGGMLTVAPANHHGS
jgi:hypothetical protein